MDSRTIYTERIDRVTDYVHHHLDESPSLTELARIACFSSFHFHRIFTAVTGESVNFFTNRLRLEKAARLLKYGNHSATDIALDCGFSSSSTFSRSFKQYFGLSPREYRKNGHIENSKICKELFPIDDYILPMSTEQLRSEFPVTIREFPQRRAAFIRVINAYEGDRVVKAFGRMVRWAKEVGVYDTETFFGMSLDDPQVTPQDKYRYEVCLTIPETFRLGSELEMSSMTLPGCTYAVTRISGDIRIVATALHYLFNDWLIDSPYEPEHQHGLEIFLEKENICNWSHFDLDLCIPVKPLQRY
jgi:AraC family transcriptional regulator